MRLKEIGKVSKKAIVRAAGLVESVKKEVVVKAVDFAACPSNCRILGLGYSESERSAFCQKHCPFVQMKEETKTEYEYEHHQYKFRLEERYEQGRLSRSQVLLYLTYHFLNIGSDGVIPYVSEQEVANTIKVSRRTIKRANERLKELHVIETAEHGKYLYNVLLPEYKTYHSTKKQGGTGYVKMTKEFLEALYAMKEVNSIRLALRLLLIFEREVELGENLHCLVTYEEMKRFLPRNMNHKKIIDEALEAVKTLFTMEAYSNHIQVALKDEYNGNIQKEVKEKRFAEEMECFVQENNLFIEEPIERKEETEANEEGKKVYTLSQLLHLYEQKSEQEEPRLLPLVGDSDQSDLVQLAMQYGVEEVKEALKRAFDYAQKGIGNSLKKIRNLGGFLRVTIENARRRAYEVKNA